MILGAGASRGADLVPTSAFLKPPLDADFFTQLRASAVGQGTDGERLLKFLEDEFGDSDVSMEAFYSQVHLHDQFIADLPRGRGRRRSYAWAMSYFLRVIPPLFGACIGQSRCKWHDALVGALDAPDVLISFNYDCIADASLRDVGRRKWDPRTGYGVTAAGEIEAWKAHVGTGRFPKRGHRLLKLHGSLNWRSSGPGLELLRDPYSPRRDGELCIVPPLWQKSFEAHPFHDLWLQARQALTATKALIVIGYSLPLTDVYTQALLRIDVQKLDFLLIANPDPAARSRLRRVLRSALGPNTRIVELEMLEDVGAVLPRPALSHQPTIEQIQKVVANRFDLAVADLRGDSRAQNVVYPRQIAMYLARELTDDSLPAIGMAFGGRDHTTVIHATSKIARLIREDRSVYEAVGELTRRAMRQSRGQPLRRSAEASVREP